MAEHRATVTADRLNVRRAGDPAGERLGTLSRGAVRHVDTTPAADGFLCRNGELCACVVATGGAGTIDETTLSGLARGAARTWNRYGGLLAPLCAATGVPLGAAVGVLCVESGGQGFVGGRLVIRFENHVFWDRWGKSHAEAFDRCLAFDATKRWTGHRYRARPSDPWTAGHRGRDGEWEAFTLARAFDEPSAMRSISMGAPQIMGFNHAAIGYESVGAMFERFSADDRYHILALFDFIKGPGRTSPMLEALRGQDYERFATHYNGNGQAAVYGARIRSVVAAFEKVAPRA